jgi:hypothetical protein
MNKPKAIRDQPTSILMRKSIVSLPSRKLIFVLLNVVVFAGASCGTTTTQTTTARKSRDPEGNQTSTRLEPSFPSKGKTQ